MEIETAPSRLTQGVHPPQMFLPLIPAGLFCPTRLRAEGAIKLVRTVDLRFRPTAYRLLGTQTVRAVLLALAYG